MKKLLLSFAVAVLSLPIFAVNLKDFSLSVEPLFGMKWGQIDEYVYQKNSAGNYQKLSELNWPIKNMFSIGLNVQGGFKKIKGKLHFSTLIPGESGIMEDSDWMDLTDVKTTYSKSENRITQAYDFSAQLKYEFQPIQQIKLSPLFEFEYKTISFEARNGYGWYGHKVYPHVSWDDPKAPYNPKGTLCGIDYKRDVTQFFIGYDFEYMPIKKLRLCQSFLISPYSYTVSYDTHYSDMASTKGTDYADLVKFYFSRLKISTGCYYILNSYFEFGLNLSFFYSFENTGTNYQKNHSDITYTNTTQNKSGHPKGGADAWVIDANISCKFNIL